MDVNTFILFTGNLLNMVAARQNMYEFLETVNVILPWNVNFNMTQTGEIIESTRVYSEYSVSSAKHIVYIENSTVFRDCPKDT